MGLKESLRSASERFGPGRFAYRVRVLWGDRAMARRNPTGAWHYLRHSRELTNFTYELANKSEMPEFVAAALDTDPALVTTLLGELRSDNELMDGLRRGLQRRASANQEPLLGKRRALYCVVRLLRPRVIVESGVKDGLGSAVLLRALERNTAEGRPGMLLGFDIDPDAGWLVDWKARARAPVPVHRGCPRHARTGSRGERSRPVHQRQPARLTSTRSLNSRPPLDAAVHHGLFCIATMPA